MTQSPYNRVEFTADFGFGEVVAAFVDFSSIGISFGVPHKVLIREGTPEDPSDKSAIREYERVTVHVDGRMESHWALGPIPDDLKTFDQNKPPLAKWDKPWSRRFELVWTPEYIEVMQPWFDNPKPATHVKCLKVSMSFNLKIQNSVVWLCVAKPESDLNDVATVVPGDGQLWALTGGWPWVLVRMSNVNNPRITNLNTVGRDYR